MIQLTVISQEQAQTIIEAAVRLLDETGVILTSAAGRQVLCPVGARVQGDRLYLPPDLVLSAVEHCPNRVGIRGRAGATKILGDGSLHWHNLGGARSVYDPRSSTTRPATVKDVQDSTRLLDALENVTTITPFFTTCDVPGEVMALAMYRWALSNTVKPLQGPGVQNALEVGYILRMAEVIGPPEEVLSLSVSPVSPLTFPDDAVEAIIAIARAGVPFGPLPCPTAGTTAPITISGALAQQTAEVLACLTLAQLIHPGLAVVYCGRLAMMEPRSGVSVWGGVELGLASAMTVQVGHALGLPVNVYGFSTNAHTLDIQNGFERVLNAALPALAGADELSGIGEMAAGVMGSYAQMVCDNEIAASVRRLRRGVDTDEQALAIDIIGAVLDGSHNFLAQKHTRQYLKAGEILITRLAERRPWEGWEADGRLGMAERAQAEAERLLAEHAVPPLDARQEQELNVIMHSAQSQFNKK